MTNNRREIKFRGWSKEHKKIGKVEIIDFGDKTIAFNYEFYKNIYQKNCHFEFEEITLIQYSNLNDIIYKDCFFDFEEVELMRYTCLKDTKDVEIYEGDIVEYYDKLYEIKWMFSGFYLHDPKGGFIELAECDECCEVVGNIYENPLLLEVI